MSSFESVPASDWEVWVSENDAVVLDIREPREWALGTLPGALRISMGQLLSRLGELDPETALLVVCRSGNRSMQVSSYLAMSGYTRVANMVGGMKALGLQD